MDCDNCKNKQPEMVSRYAMEELSARQDIANRRSFVINIILIVLLLASWIGFFVYESQFDKTVITTTQEVEQQADGDSDNNFVGGDYYGSTAEGEDHNNG